MNNSEDQWVEAGGGDNMPMWDGEKPIQGVYVAKRSGVGPNNSMVYTLKQGEEQIGIWGSTVLDTKFEQIPLQSEVKVEYLGREEGKRGSYKNYRVLYKAPKPSALEDVFGPGTTEI